MAISQDWIIDLVDKKISHVQFKDEITGTDSSIAEVTEVTVLAASGITTGDYFLLYSATDATSYYLWYNKNSGGGDPAISGKTGIAVAIATSDANTVVATATRDAINSTAGTDFTATAASAVVTITNDAKGSTTDASDSSGGTSTGFTFNVTAQGMGKTVWTVNALYSFLQGEFDELNNLDENMPISAQTPTEYTMINGWFIDEVSIKYLKGGALQTSGWASGKIRQINYNSNSGFHMAAADIGRTITGTTTADAGAILFFDERTVDNDQGRLWIRPTVPANDLFDNGSEAYTIGASSAAGVFTAVSVSGENTWANIYTLGTLETIPKPITYIFQGGTYISGWWGRGDATSHIDILIRVKEAGSEIASGVITVFVRQYADFYDNFEIDLSAGGRNAIPLASQTDPNNNTLGEAYLLYDGQTSNFTVGKILTGQTSGATAEIIANTDSGTTGYLTLGNVTGTFDNDETIKDDNTTQGVAVVNGTIGDTILNFDAETAGFTTLGQIITGQTTFARRALTGVQDDGATGTLLLQVSDTANVDHFKTYNDNETITGASNGSATSNGVSITNTSGFADIKVWFMNVEVDFTSKNGVINEGDAVTGASSGATAIFLGEKDSNTLQLANWSGTSFTVGEQLQKIGATSNYYVLTNPTNQTANHLINRAFQLQSAYPYSVLVDCAGRKVAQAYEWLKYITREKANVSQIRRQILYPLISSTVTQQDGEEYISARVSPDTAYVQSKASPFGTFSGGKLFGAQGVWIQDMHSDDIQAFQLVDANSTIQNPPNFQVVKVTGVVSGDKVTVFRTTGANNIVNKAIFTSASGNNIANTTFVVNEAIPADTPSSGIIRIIDVSDTTNDKERRYSYSSWTTSTFSGITKTFGDSSPGLDRSYTLTDDTAFVPYIDTTASSTEVSQTIIYTASRNLVTWVRRFNNSTTIIPSETIGTLSSSGYLNSIVRTTDPIAGEPAAGPALLVFDFVNKKIIVPDTDTTLNVQYLVDRTREVEDDFQNAMSQTSILSATGKDNLGGGVYTGITANLLDGWQVKFADRTGSEVQCFISGGNLVGGPAGNPIAVSTNVRVVQISSSAAVIAKSETDTNLFYAIEGLRKTHRGVGKFFYWDPVNGNNSSSGLSDTTPVQTFAQAQSLATSGANDTIICLAKATSGIVTVDETLPITKNNLRIRGPGYSFQVKPTGTTSDTISINATGVEISGLYIETAATGARDAITITGNSNLITNCWIGLARGSGVNITGSSFTKIEECAIEHCGGSGTGDGIKIGATTQQLVMSKNIIFDCKNGISLAGSSISDNVIENNLIYMNTSYGIDIASGVLRTHGRSGNTLSKNTTANTRDLGTDTLLETKGGESAAAIADQVWDELISDHVGAGSTGRTLRDIKTRATLASLK